METIAGRDGERVPVRVIRKRRSLQPQTRLSRLAIQELVDAYIVGASVRDLVDRFGVNRTTVLEQLSRHGVPTRRFVRKLTDEQVAVAGSLYVKGSSLARLAEVYEVDPNTVRRELVQAGVTIRPRRGWEARGMPT